jgi:hypothetical protein
MDKLLHRSKQRASSTILLNVVVDRQDSTDLTGSQLTLRISTADRSFLLLKTSTNAGITFTLQTPEKLEAFCKVNPSDILVSERCRLYFAYELTLPNGDQLYLSEPGHDWFEFYPEVGL